MTLNRIIRLLAITATMLLFACSNSEYVDEFGVPVSMYAPDEDADTTEPSKQDSASKPDTLTEFPPSGFFAKPFTVSLPEKMNCETGGFVPTKNSPVLQKVKIDSSTTIRCVNFSNTSSVNTEIIRTYLFEKKPTIPAVFITTDPNSLFDPDTGIYMEGPNAEKEIPHYGANYWLDKEIPIFIELIETNTNVPSFSKKAGLEIFGHWSRTNAKKSVAITFREKYGDKRLNYPLFPEHPNLMSFKSFVLRNNGQNFKHDYIRDRLATSISEGLNVDYQRGRFVIVFYNNKFFGIHDMRERSNEYYFETHYGMNHKNINLLKANNSASAGSATAYISLMQWIKTHNLNIEKNYEYVLSKIDIENFINYMQVEIFAYNYDWPEINQKKWNYTISQTTSPWRWFLYDLDLSFGRTNDVIPSNVFEYVSAENSNYHRNSPESTFLIRNLLQNKNFKASFINRMTTLTHMNFESSRVLAQIEKIMSEIESEILRDQKRWSLNSSHMAEQLEMINAFAKERPSTIIKHLQSFFNLGEITPVNFSINGNGIILVHGLPLDRKSLTIEFFKGFPVTVSAKPQNGSSWSRWSDGDTNSTRMFYPERTNDLIAIFKQ